MCRGWTADDRLMRISDHMADAHHVICHMHTGLHIGPVKENIAAMTPDSLPRIPHGLSTASPTHLEVR